MTEKDANKDKLEEHHEINKVPRRYYVYAITGMVTAILTVSSMIYGIASLYKKLEGKKVEKVYVYDVDRDGRKDIVVQQQNRDLTIFLNRGYWNYKTIDQVYAKESQLEEKFKKDMSRLNKELGELEKELELQK
jgi:hypothetical protein